MGHSKSEIKRFEKRKQYKHKLTRKQYIESIEKRAFSNARAKFTGHIWKAGQSCYYEHFPTCLLQFVEAVTVENSEIGYAKVAVTRVFGNGTTAIGTEFIVPYREIITLTQLETEIQILLKNDGYGEQEDISRMKLLYSDYHQALNLMAGDTNAKDNMAGTDNISVESLEYNTAAL